MGNAVLNTGGADTGYGYDMAGINFYGPDARILNNDVIDLDNTGDGSSVATGIQLGLDVDGSIVANNRVSNVRTDGGGSIGIGLPVSGVEVPTANGVVIDDNTITSSEMTSGTGILGGPGGPTPTDNLCRDNTVFRFSDGITHCVDGGGNYPPPTSP